MSVVKRTATAVLAATGVALAGAAITTSAEAGHFCGSYYTYSCSSYRVYHPQPAYHVAPVVSYQPVVTYRPVVTYAPVVVHPPRVVYTVPSHAYVGVTPRYWNSYGIYYGYGVGGSHRHLRRY